MGESSLASLDFHQRLLPGHTFERSQNPAEIILGAFAQSQRSIMAIPRLSQSKSKSEFFERLGWDENDEIYKRLYQMMMEEAAHGRQRTVQDRNNLTPQSRNDPRVGDGPYSSAMITETARYREIQSIYTSASPETRWWYDRGITSESGWDNWIIRWCLWHVFRYRDDRNRNRRSPQRNTTPPEWGNSDQSSSQGYPQTQGTWEQQPTYPTNRYVVNEVRTRYDPVYDRTSIERINHRNGRDE